MRVMMESCDTWDLRGNDDSWVDKSFGVPPPTVSAFFEDREEDEEEEEEGSVFDGVANLGDRKL